MPTHCTVTCFVFRALRIDGDSVIYFQFTHLLGRPRYTGDVYLYLCTERIEVRVTICVIVFVLIMCCIWDDEGNTELNPVPEIAYSYQLNTKGTARLKVPIRRTNRYQQYGTICLLNICTAKGFGI